MSLKNRSLIQDAMAQVSMESEQGDDYEQRRAAEAAAQADAYETGVEVSDDAAEDAAVGAELSAELSMEASPKELRNGMKVKFSHGHGKIARVFTGPFKLDKKNHHATKDAPLYLVRHDKGGKHSLHKASALRVA